MVFDSHYDEYRGAITYVRVMNGTVRKGTRRSASCKPAPRTKCSSWASSCRSASACDQLQAGQVGYLICNIKSLGKVHIGDTVTRARRRSRPKPLPGYRRAASGWSTAACIRPTARTSRSCATRSTSSAINDPSFEFEPETSDALGFGFRCGFLGLLHMEIVQQRLEQEADIDLVQTAPNVTYEIIDQQRRDAANSQAAKSARRWARSKSFASRSCA